MDVFGPNSVPPRRPARRERGFRGYGPEVLDHYENPRNVGEVESPSAAAWVESPAHGDRLKLTLRITGGVISEARFKAFGCGAAIASSSMATVLLKGRTLEQARCLNREELSRALGGLPEGKLQCSVLAEEAVKQALDDYERRQDPERAEAATEPDGRE